MKSKIDDIFYPVWEGLDYSEELEPFIDVFTCGKITDEEEIRCINQLLLLPQTEFDGSEIPQDPEFIRKFEDKYGESYLVGNNSFQKVFKKSPFINTMSMRNEVIQTPTDATQIWFISPTIKLKNKNDL